MPPIDLPQEIADRATQPHAVNNVTVPITDWYMLREAAALETPAEGPKVTRSDIIRIALDRYLNEHPHAESIARLAELRLRQDIELEKARAQQSTEIIE
ncbi:MAG: hypothetical protein V4702_06480 [Patescibacteria group bacterium]